MFDCAESNPRDRGDGHWQENEYSGRVQGARMPHLLQAPTGAIIRHKSQIVINNQVVETL